MTANDQQSVATPRIISSQAESDLLTALEHWNIIEKGSQEDGTAVRELHRLYKFKDFDTALAFMSRAADAFIIAMDHHPRWENSYSRVEIWLTTHDLNNGISTLDARMAQSFEALWQTLSSEK